MKKIVYAVIFLLIIVIIGVFLWRVLISPQYSLKKLEDAMEENNVTAFNKYVDLDATVDGIIEQTWNFYTSGETTGSRWSEIRNEIGSSLLSVVKPNIKEMVKKEVLSYISTGQWPGSSPDNQNGISELVMNLIRDKIDPSQWDRQSINYTKIAGDTAYIGLTYYDESNKTNFIVEVKMRDMSGYWQVIEISNIADILNIFQNIDDI
ncbi:MAG: hypothetical protein WCV43_01950 [Candidatus Caldatribacteriota bacterium]|nr:hypothetical protein [Atribacterota bacterium]MDD4288412.1 hypothetical protein [Atribacterota bacterium]